MRTKGILRSGLIVALLFVLSPAASSSQMAPIYVPPTPVSSDPITWANLIARSADIPERAWSYAQSTITNNLHLPSAKAKFQIVRSPSLGATFYADAARWMVRVNALYAHIPKPPMTYLFFTNPRDLDWTSKKSATLVPFGDPQSIYAMYSGGTFSKPLNCTGSSPARAYSIEATSEHAFFAVVLGGSCIGGESNNEDSVTHEYTHQIQALILPGGDHHVFEPCWMTEGQAAWTAGAEADTYAGYVSNMHLGPYYLSQAGTDSADPGIKIWTKQMLLDYYKKANVPSQCWKTNRYALSYSLGTATVEAMVAIAGAESHMAFEERLAAGQSIDTAFKKVYGITWKAAAPILAEYVAKRITDGISGQEHDSKVTSALLPATTKLYRAVDSAASYRIADDEGCSKPKDKLEGFVSARAVLQAQVIGEWIDVPSSDSGWTKSENCSSAALGEKNFQPWVVVHMDNGTLLRWKYAGEVNIFARDANGFGISHTTTFKISTAKKA